jgi:hypothetical protein
VRKCSGGLGGKEVFWGLGGWEVLGGKGARQGLVSRNGGLETPKVFASEAAAPWKSQPRCRANCGLVPVRKSRKDVSLGAWRQGALVGLVGVAVSIG